MIILSAPLAGQLVLSTSNLELFLLSELESAEIVCTLELGLLVEELELLVGVLVPVLVELLEGVELGVCGVSVVTVKVASA